VKIAELRRYPVKSMAGELIDTSRIDPGSGLHGDRALAIIDVETGNVASGKHPRKWAALLGFRASLSGARHVTITLPDGRTITSDQPDADEILSEAVGRKVRLADTPPPQARYEEHDARSDRGKAGPLAVGAGEGTFFDYAPVHLVTTATLARFSELNPQTRFDVLRFRPNLVIDTGDQHGFVENDWLGEVLEIGEQARVCITFPCPRCVMTTLAQGDLPSDPAVLRTATEHNRQWFALLAKKLPTVGAYAVVVRGGTIRTGDAVRLGGKSSLQRAEAFAHSLRRALWRR
jgi:uncharacterized protein YcbX